MNTKRIGVLLGTKLQKRRSELGFTQVQVAQAAKTKMNYYAKLERGEAIPSLKMLFDLAKALQTTPAELLLF